MKDLKTIIEEKLNRYTVPVDYLDCVTTDTKTGEFIPKEDFAIVAEIIAKAIESTQPEVGSNDNQFFKNKL